MSPDYYPAHWHDGKARLQIHQNGFWGQVMAFWLIGQWFWYQDLLIPVQSSYPLQVIYGQQVGPGKWLHRLAGLQSIRPAWIHQRQLSPQPYMRLYRWKLLFLAHLLPVVLFSEPSDRWNHVTTQNQWHPYKLHQVPSVPEKERNQPV